MSSQDPSAPILQFREMSRRYGDTKAVRSLSLSIRPGEMFGLVGPDGAGKSTSLRVALGLLRATSGAVTTCGLDPHPNRRELSHEVGYLPQRFSLYEDLTVDENVAFFARIHAVKGWQERRKELLELVRMSPFRKRLAGRLSGGMKQKLALACTLIHQPRLLVLDEPTAGVDPVSRRDFWQLLAGLQLSGLSVVMTTAYLDEAERCARVGFLHKGELLALGKPQELQSQFQQTVLEVVARPAERTRDFLRAHPEVDSAESFGERVHAILHHHSPISDSMLADELRERGLQVHSCRQVLPSLEDIFIAMIRAADTRTQEVA
jgi:ABC-2 type transport system ATP-binding protein